MFYLLANLVVIIYKNKILIQRKIKNIFRSIFETFYKNKKYYLILLIVITDNDKNIFYLEKGFDVKEIMTHSKFLEYLQQSWGFLGGFFALEIWKYESTFFRSYVDNALSNLTFALAAILIILVF